MRIDNHLRIIVVSGAASWGLETGLDPGGEGGDAGEAGGVVALAAVAVAEGDHTDLERERGKSAL